MLKKQSFIKGTAILILANAISKILGAVFKIPLAYILKEEGMAIFNTAMGVYSMVLTFIISGLPIALSRYVAEEYTLKNYITVKRAVKLSTLIFCGLGIIGSLILYFFADFFALAMKDPKAVFAIKVISPAVFFVAWGNVYKSFYQGCVNMTPTAISQIIEAVIKLFVGIAFAYTMRNFPIDVTSAGGIFGITAGEIIATFILFMLFIPTNKKIPYTGEKRRKREIIDSISAVAIPMLVSSCILGMLNLVDVAMIRNGLLKIEFTPLAAKAFLLKYSSYTTCFDNLEKTMKLTIDGARWLYGAYSGYALTIFHLPTGIIAALGMSVLPLISGALAKKDNALLEKTTVTALKLTLLVSMPSATVMLLFGEPILELLFNNTASAGMLTQLAPCLVFVCVSQLFTVILNASGRVVEPFLYSFLGVLIKLSSNLILIPNPAFNISGAIIGSNIGFFVVMILNGMSVVRNLGIKLLYKKSLVRLLIACFVMGLILKLLYTPMTVIFTNTAVAVIVTVFVGLTAYLLSLISMNVINRQEIKSIKV